MSARLRTTLQLVALVVSSGAVSCGGPQKLGEAGTKCFRDDDCVAGLICVAPTTGDIHRVCSNDPTPIISMVEMPELATGGTAGTGGAATAGAGAGAGGKAPTAGSSGSANGGMPASAGSGGSSVSGGGNETAGTDTGGTASGGTEMGGTDTGGTDSAGGAPP